jgi:hypothetical protein
LKAFLDDFAAARLAERVVVLCFSEFEDRVLQGDAAASIEDAALPSGGPAQTAAVCRQPVGDVQAVEYGRHTRKNLDYPALGAQTERRGGAGRVRGLLGGKDPTGRLLLVAS